MSRKDSTSTINQAANDSKSRRPWYDHILTVVILICVAAGGWLVSKEPTTEAASRAASMTNRSSAALPTYLTKNIEDIRAGDLVLAREENGTKLGYRKVVETYRRTSYHLRHLTFEAEDGSQQTIHTTDEHPFWHAKKKIWLEAGHFATGDPVTTPDGRLQMLTATKRTEHPSGVQVFNFQVEEYHTYFVNDKYRTHPILSHNAECGATLIATVGATPEPVRGRLVYSTTESIREALEKVSNKLKGTVSQDQQAAKDLAEKMAKDAGVLNPTIRLDTPGGGKWPHYHVEELTENLHFWFPK